MEPDVEPVGDDEEVAPPATDETGTRPEEVRQAVGKITALPQEDPKT